LGTQEVVLGDSTFEEENDLQIHKFKMFQKPDRETFPTSHLGLNLAKVKAPKNGLEKALRVGSVALCIG